GEISADCATSSPDPAVISPTRSTGLGAEVEAGQAEGHRAGGGAARGLRAAVALKRGPPGIPPTSLTPQLLFSTATSSMTPRGALTIRESAGCLSLYSQQQLRPQSSVPLSYMLQEHLRSATSACAQAHLRRGPRKGL